MAMKPRTSRLGRGLAVRRCLSSPIWSPVTAAGLRKPFRMPWSRSVHRWRRIVRGGNPEAYVRRSIVNADRALWRRFRRRETLVAGVPLVALVDVADEVATRDAAWGLCSTLPRRQRAAVVLRYYEGLSDAEIGAILGCSPGTVRSQIHRALAALRQRLRTQEEVGQG